VRSSTRASDGEQAARDPTQLSRCQGIFPRYKDDGGLGRTQGAAVDCQAWRWSSRSRTQLGIASKEDSERYGIAEFNQSAGESVFEFLEEWTADGADRLWIDLERRLQDASTPRHRSRYGWARGRYGTAGSSSRATRSFPTAPATRRRCHRTRCRWATRTSSIVGVRDVPVLEPRGARRKGIAAVWTRRRGRLVSNAAVAVDQALPLRVRARRAVRPPCSPGARRARDSARGRRC